ncbi:MAG: YheV family putative zinc ribbon protein [Symbiopectobacterium sp.]
MQRKQFIAGAVCPKYQAQDTLSVWQEDQVDVVTCVKCDLSTATVRSAACCARAAGEHIIGIFILIDRWNFYPRWDMGIFSYNLR